VIATTAGGLPDKVVPGMTGWLVAPGDADGLSQTIAGALQDAPRLPQLGRAARALVEERFTWASAVRALLAAVAELQAGR